MGGFYDLEYAKVPYQAGGAGDARRTHKRGYYVYPQAGLRTYGHLQTDSAPTVFYPILADINRSVICGPHGKRRSRARYSAGSVNSTPFLEGEGEGEGEGGEPADSRSGRAHSPSPNSQRSRSSSADSPPYSPSGAEDLGPDAVIWGGMQMYNVRMHRVRPSALDHDAQTGQITAALCERYVRGDKEMRKLRNLSNTLDAQGLPHQRYYQKCRSKESSYAYRLEAIIHIDMARIDERYRDGRCVAAVLQLLLSLTEVIRQQSLSQNRSAVAPWLVSPFRL